MKYIYELNDSQFNKYSILASNKSRGLITEEEFKEGLDKIIND